MKKSLVAALIMASMASAANAQNMFAFMGQQDASNVIIIEPLNAESDGYVAVYDHHSGVVGELLGAARITAGANSQTRIQVGRTVRRDAIAYLFAGSDFSDPANALDSVEINIDNDND